MVARVHEKDSVVSFLQWLNSTKWASISNNKWYNGRNYITSEQLAKIYMRHRSDLDKIYTVRDYLTVFEDYKNPPTIEQLSIFVGMSTSKLKVLFKQEIGHNIYQFLLRHKLRKAKNMLMKGCFSVAVVAKKFGYISHANFVKVFCQEYGVHPRELVKK